ncbi:MAG: SAM-dependent methyltransferase [Tepidiformaceae bacterium]
MARPALILAGYGVGDSLQLTVESQRAMARASRVFSIGLPPNLRALLRAQKVSCVDLAGCFAGARAFGEAYLDIADTVLRHAESDPPVLLLSEGNPLLSNALNRFLLMKAKERKIATQVLAAVSPIDSLICQVGLDVGTFGLQVFDARRLYSREMPVQPSVPLLLLQVAGVAQAETSGAMDPQPGAYRPLTEYLARFYPPTHVVVHLANSSDPQATAVTAAPLDAFDSLVPRFGPASTLFVDLLRQPAAAT